MQLLLVGEECEGLALVGNEDVRAGTCNISSICQLSRWLEKRYASLVIGCLPTTVNSLLSVGPSFVIAWPVEICVVVGLLPLLGVEPTLDGVESRTMTWRDAGVNVNCVEVIANVGSLIDNFSLSDGVSLWFLLLRRRSFAV